MKILSALALFVTFFALKASGQTWTPVFGPLGINVEAMIFDDGHVLIGTDTGTFSTNNNGGKWDEDTVGLEAPDQFCYLITLDQVLLVGTETAGIFRSSDLGLHWQASSTGLPTGVSVPSLVRDDGNVILAAVPGYGAYISLDDGFTWKIDTSGLASIHSWCLTHSKNGDFIIGLTGAIGRSTDQGATWTTSLTLDASDEVLSLGCDSSGNLFAGTFRGAILLSQDNGSNWQKIDSGLTPVRCFTFFGNSIYAGTFGSGMLVGNDQPGDWDWWIMNNGLSGENLKLLVSAVTPDGYLFVGTDTGIVFRIPLNASGVAKSEASLAIKLEQTPDGIRVYLPQSEDVELRVFDVLGRQLATLCDGILPAGTHTYTIPHQGNQQSDLFAALSTKSGTFVLPILNETLH